LSVPKKILYVSPNGYLGGAERFVLTAVKAHAQAGNFEVAILFFSDGEACQEAERAGLNCFVLSRPFRFRSPWKLFYALREMRNIVKSFNPDMLHLTMPYAHIALSLATLGLNLKKVWFQQGPVGGRLDQIANLFPVDMIFYNSLYLQEMHRKAWPPARVRVQETIIRYGVESCSNAHSILMHSPLILGTAGRICSWKGFHNILYALGELKSEGALRPFKLHIAGDAKTPHDQRYKQDLLNLTRTLQLTDEVEFLGHKGKMDDFYQSVDLFIHSSIIPEPFGLVVAEAMINGCLVIVSDDGGVRDIVKDGMNGLTFTSTTSNAVTDLKKQLSIFLKLKNNFEAKKYQTIAEQGRQFIQNNYSIPQMRAQLEELYLKLSV